MLEITFISSVVFVLFVSFVVVLLQMMQLSGSGHVCGSRAALEVIGKAA